MRLRLLLHLARSAHNSLSSRPCICEGGFLCAESNEFPFTPESGPSRVMDNVEPPTDLLDLCHYMLPFLSAKRAG